MQQPAFDPLNQGFDVPIVARGPKEIEESVDRLDQLVSLMFDEGLSEGQAEELNQMLLDDADARGRYIEASLLHADLIDYFREERDAS